MSLLFLNEFVVGLEGTPDAVAHFWVQLFETVVNLLDVRAVRVGLVGTDFLLLLIALQFGVGLDFRLGNEAERTDDGERHLAHLQQGGHCAESALEAEVQQGGMDDVVLMMAEGYLIAAEFLCQIEHLLSAVPGTEKAGLLLASFEL